ncbi:MAG: hypothetical protein RLZZ444_1809, partial [Pseudomonadota bacterium]
MKTDLLSKFDISAASVETLV